MEMFLTGFPLSLSACLDVGIVTVATIKRGLDGERPRGAGTQPGLPGRVDDRVIALLQRPLLEVERG